MPNRKITKKIEKMIVKLYCSGLTAKETAIKIGFSRTTIGIYLKKNRIKRRKAYFYSTWKNSMKILKMKGHRPPHYKGKDHPSWRGGKKEVNCDECKKIIKKHPSFLRDGRKHFCDRVCFSKWKSRNTKDKNNPFFGKKHTLETRRKISLAEGGTGIPYENTEYGAEFDNVLKEKIRFRDKYRCRFCGCSQLENGKCLDVHHIDYNKRNSVLKNLIALCVRCHRKTKANRKYYTVYFTGLLNENREVNV